MNNKNNRLGKGLSALLKNNSNIDNNLIGNIINIEIEKIDINPWQPRNNFDSKCLKELIISIKNIGVIQPITVRKKENSYRYEIISGERRVRACKLAGNNKIPAYIRVANDEEMLEIALIENIQRQDLNAIEIAISYKQLIKELGLTQDQLAKRIGKDRSTITNHIRLLKLDPIIQSGIRDNIISMGHGRALLSIKEHNTQIIVYKKIIKYNLSVRDTEKLINKILKSNNIEKQEFTYTFLENDINYIEKHLDAKIYLYSKQNGKGKITLKFNSEYQLKKIINLLKN